MGIWKSKPGYDRGVRGDLLTFETED